MMELNILSHEPEILQYSSGLIQIKIPLDNPLRWVNSYVLQHGRELAVIDPGPRTARAEREWELVLQKLGMQVQEITSIVLTHHHPDHYGLAGFFQELSGAAVWMSERAHQEAKLMWGKHSSMSADLPAFFRIHGMPAAWLEQLPGHLDSFLPQVKPAPQARFLRDGDVVPLGGRLWQAVQTHGHAPGHLSFWHAESGDLICGDAVLPQISPNVSLLPGSDAQPLHSFLEGLRRLRELPVRTAYPGHRNPFTHYRERIDALLAHHEERLDTAADLLQTAGPQSAFEVCTALFGGRLGIHQMRFAMCEALAHLAELSRRSRAVPREHPDGWISFAVPE
ncbi:metallo-beta-lactamase domain protein [Paenibacillus algicola]|uniref:Metallo-beta-lactamase domain protein n=2 Tax=Paenibacillus algicola TaxID=2565926 RepID=A0A4P8XI95_9BACL|nr:metallo-beta-lactamase domain protein [Paenibacillus algicola]